MPTTQPAAESFLGVSCRRCGKPVRVPDRIASSDSPSRPHNGPMDVENHFASRVFILRCRSCQKESIYAVNEIVDFSLTEKLV